MSKDRKKMTEALTTPDLRDYTKEVHKTHRVKKCYGNEVIPYEYLVDIYDNLTMVTDVIDKGDKTSTYKTSHGTLTLNNTDKVSVRNGEIYEGRSGTYIINFLKGLIQTIAKTNETSIQAVFSDVEFTVHRDDTLDDLCDKWDSTREKIRAGLVNAYNS